DGWRRRWGKPVFIDEMGYEGDLDQGWGSLTAEEFVLRSWMVIMRGGHVTHGETFWSDDEVIFWAKGGDLKGDALSRLAFLQQIIAESPEGILEPLASEFDASWAGTPGRSVLIFLGRGRPLFRDVPVPAGHTARIEVIDAWNMTIDAVPGEHEGTVRVNLPARPAMAIRLTLAVKEIPDDY
ncbi:MAG: hypothetical protein JWP75_1922, partial [Frondihabitans sp.]|nr:hypothetical protein [Frondihabitans sp.]